jgi:hypothetical protein
MLHRSREDGHRGTGRLLLRAILLAQVAFVGTTALSSEEPSPAFISEDPSRARYFEARRLAEAGKTEGYRRLIAMATNDQSAEWGEAANERIMRLLHKDAGAWLRAVAPLDGPSLRGFMPWCIRIWPMLEGEAEYGGGLPTFRKDLLVGLRAAKGTPREIALASFMIDLVKAQRDVVDAKPANP